MHLANKIVSIFACHLSTHTKCRQMKISKIFTFVLLYHIVDKYLTHNINKLRILYDIKDNVLKHGYTGSICTSITLA